MARFRLNPKHDFVFCTLFGEQESKRCLISLLNAILGQNGQLEQIKDLKIKSDRRIRKLRLGDKAGILDVSAKLDSGELINVEMQRKDMGNMIKRSLFYMSSIYAGSIRQGKDHSRLKRTIVINLLDYRMDDLPDDHHFHHIYRLRNERPPHQILTDVLEVHFIEFPKFERIVKDLGNPLHRWLMFMDEALSDSKLKELMEMDSAIEEAEKQLERLRDDDEFMRQLRAYKEKSEIDWNSSMNYYMRKGLEEGQRTLVANMFRNGLDPASIAKLTNLSFSEVERMVRQLNQ